jgi:hypothetical protein
MRDDLLFDVWRNRPFARLIEIGRVLRTCGKENSDENEGAGSLYPIYCPTIETDYSSSRHYKSPWIQLVSATHTLGYVGELR